MSQNYLDIKYYEQFLKQYASKSKRREQNEPGSIAYNSIVGAYIFRFTKIQRLGWLGQTNESSSSLFENFLDSTEMETCSPEMVYNQ